MGNNFYLSDFYKKRSFDIMIAIKTKDVLDFKIAGGRGHFFKFCMGGSAPSFSSATGQIH